MACGPLGLNIFNVDQNGYVNKCIVNIYKTMPLEGSTDSHTQKMVSDWFPFHPDLLTLCRKKWHPRGTPGLFCGEPGFSFSRPGPFSSATL